VVLGDPAKPFSISDDQWAEIEKTYGRKLDEAVRFKILRVTASFVMFEPFERAAPPSAEAEKRARSIKDSAGRFFSDLFNRPNDDATIFADELIDRHSKRRMPQLRELLLSLAAARNPALVELEASPTHREGEYWDRWIRGLTITLDGADLPTAASKGRGKSKSDSPSPFVLLVLKLQGYVPKEACRHNTPDGLATAIGRARKGRGSKS
jgi:hypothetical protein